MPLLMTYNTMIAIIIIIVIIIKTLSSS